MLAFLEGSESNGAISPGQRLLETTTGNSGSSFAWLCRVLGYPEPVIIIPGDMPAARRAQIRSFGAELVESPAGEYISGIEKKFREVYFGSKSQSHGQLYCPKHWADEVFAVRAMRECGEEILAQSREINVDLDYFMLALGNGSSSRGIAQAFEPEDIVLLGMEPEESPIVAEFVGQDGFLRRRPGSRQHGIIGTGPADEQQIYPNMRAAARLLKYIEHVNTPECRAMQQRLADECALHVGMSSAGCVASIVKYIERENIRNASFGFIIYDPSWKYF